MSNQPETQSDPLSDLFAFIHNRTVAAMTARHGNKEGQEAAVRVFSAIRTAISTAKSPIAFASCTDLSILNCINQSINLDLYPGGPNPNVYLVPQSPRKGEPMEMQWRITHRGLATLAARAGFSLNVVAVAKGDHIEVDMGEVVSHRPADLSRSPTMGTLMGMIVVVKRQQDAVAITRAWVPADIITARQAKARDQSIWQQWPMEMASKTALKYVFARGIAVLESLASVIAADNAMDIEATPEPSTARRTVTLPTSAPALPGPAPIPESRQLAAPPPMPDADWSPAPDLVPVQQIPAPTPATRAAAPAWAVALKPELDKLARATGAKSNSAALAAAGITVPESPDIEALRLAITEATITAQERDAPAAR